MKTIQYNIQIQIVLIHNMSIIIDVLYVKQDIYQKMVNVYNVQNINMKMDVIIVMQIIKKNVYYVEKIII